MRFREVEGTLAVPGRVASFVSIEMTVWRGTGKVRRGFVAVAGLAKDEAWKGKGNGQGARCWEEGTSGLGAKLVLPRYWLGAKNKPKVSVMWTWLVFTVSSAA